MNVLLLFSIVASLAVFTVNGYPVGSEDEDIDPPDLAKLMEKGDYEPVAERLIELVNVDDFLTEALRDMLDKATSELYSEWSRSLTDNLDMKKQKFLYDMDKVGIDSGIVEYREKIVQLSKKMIDIGVTAQTADSDKINEDARAHFLTMAGEFAFYLDEVTEDEENTDLKLALKLYEDGMMALRNKYEPKVPADHKLYVRLSANYVKASTKDGNIDEAFDFALKTQLRMGELYTQERKKEIVTEVGYDFERLMRERKEAEE